MSWSRNKFLIFGKIYKIFFIFRFWSLLCLVVINGIIEGKYKEVWK